ncbi:hydrogenase maturation protease [Amycolatopsis pittospori]|uniref:hydrogenase maturation protease n=1 Tax=Amycolatopsis pittospori TaxID=2749434 RepID=UPI0015F0E3B8|nr:hydrogenase maturation protease [Amycolatopsis pittospori]
MTRRVLVAGVGNIFLGDDGFGVEVVRRLSTQDFPDGVRVADYGIRGLHLAYDLAGGGYGLTVLVDATMRGDPPGTVYVVELDLPDGPPQVTGEALDAHGMQPDVVLNLVALLGGDPGRVLLVGCEPAVLAQRMGLSPAVEAAVGTAAGVVADLVEEYTDPETGRKQVPPCVLAFPEK